MKKKKPEKYTSSAYVLTNKKKISDKVKGAACCYARTKQMIKLRFQCPKSLKQTQCDRKKNHVNTG